MRSVLGIDAAWSSKHPSGVALAVETSTGWRLICAASSYDHFHTAGLGRTLTRTFVGSIPDIPALLRTCEAKLQRSVDLVAIDMPLSLEPITARRESDNAVSRAYGGRKCGTHSPNDSSPGRISDDLRSSFDREGYRLQTCKPVKQGLIEVYPHPALVELANASERLKYKYGKRAKLWPELCAKERLEQLRREWRKIVSLLDSELEDVTLHLTEPMQNASGSALKAFEDALDAVICVWVGICVLEEKATPFGDSISAIWVPTARSNS